MDKWSFGLTLLVVGIAGTFVTLWVLALAVEALKKVFPLEPEEKK
jgi:Na+-transporting methylmalonyl-CoA/oxaloacetate decarboxylase gamma subunit